MISDAPPAVIRHAGVMVMPDWYVPPWSHRIVFALATLWILFGPVWIFLGVRSGRGTRPAVGYAVGVLLATIALIATVLGPPTWDRPAHRIDVLVQYFGGQILLVAGGLGSIAAVIGWLMRRPGERKALD